MKIFITGASGFIGRQLAFRLAAEDHSVAVLLRDPTVAGEYNSKGIKVITGDISDKGALKSGMADCDWVFHLAAYTRPVSADPDLPYRTNVQGTVNVLESAKVQSVRKVIIASTAGTLSYSIDGNTVDEETSRIADYHTEYERTKAAAEKKALKYGSDRLDVIIVNPTRVYGPGKLTAANSLTRIMDLYGRGLWRFIPGDGDATGNYVFISDVVNGLILAALHGKGGQRYILGGENITYRELFRLVGVAYGKERKMITVSEAWLKRFAGLAGIFSKVTGKPAFISGEWIDRYLKDWIMSSKKAELLLNYKITPFAEGAGLTVSWLRSHRSSNG